MRVLVFLLVLLAGCGSAPRVDQLDFSLPTLSGETFSGSSLAGKPAALWFWAPWCPSCRAEASTVAEAARSHPEVKFLGVASRDEVAVMRTFVAERGLGDIPHLADVEGEVWKRFGVTAQPAWAFVSASGKVDVIIGAPTADDLDDRLKRLMAGEPQPTLG